ncbi:cupin domain-containing protein [Sphingomonas immobilis]|uniref:Cupin domain-containing protein n=1 Tax=Sphingomonas immobilis TaxID=3063997 RepID=A0ABT8ZYG5_9SPHN|nr:cupin domain-containing protein [Sphingomonas sp. CA1-15]MDO7842620.1 cupin domain-containing protein [Sphingomonas sp. CA1-15]
MTHPLVASLDLAPHPEGGWYRETMRQPAPGGDPRGLASAILFLLEEGQRSHWHRVDAVELWLWHAGSPLTLLIHEVGETREIVLSADTPQGLVPAHAWQSTEAPAGWGLVSCVVTPGFTFDGFELAPPGWSPA